MGYSDVKKRREYARKWYAQRRATFFAGKCCVVCGSRDQLELDHVDQTTKVSHSIWSWSRQRREAELAKCQILCDECHTKKSIADNSGQRHHSSKLTDLQRSEIRLLFETGDHSKVELARLFGVADTTIGAVIRNISRSTPGVSRPHKSD